MLPGMADNDFEILEAQEKLPRLKNGRDGFSRQDVVNAFQNAFTMIGGAQRLALWANANPDRFFPLYAKLMPSTSFQFGAGDLTRIEHAIPPTPLDVHPGEEPVYVPREDNGSEV